MFGLDETITKLGDSGLPLVVVAVAFLLGLRHATDPDHLVAVSTLIATEPERPVRRAATLGLSWALGHASTLVLLGLPIVFLGEPVSQLAQRAAEVLVGLVIMALALRLVLRWRRASFHAHVHAHGRVVHRHLHRHDEDRHVHEHVHEPPTLARSPVQAYAVGLLHGVGGSAAVGILVVASIGPRVDAAAALVAFAAGTAISMTGLSCGLGYALARAPFRRRFAALAPVLGAASFVFGAWYALAALGGSA